MTARYFYVGDTVMLGLRISVPGTERPTNPASVTLAFLGLFTEGSYLPVTTTALFVKVNDGYFRLALPTAALAPGRYVWRARLDDGPEAVTLVEDEFGLRVPTR